MKMTKTRKIMFTVVVLKLILIVALVLVSLFFNTSQNPKLQNIVNTYLNEHRVDDYLSTVVMSVQCKSKNGKTILATAYAGILGHGDNPIEQQKTGKDDIFEIGSITKSFVSVVLLQLENEPKYKFNLDDTVGKWFPEAKYKNWGNIKIRQVLNMTSGIPSYSTDLKFNNYFVQHPDHSFSLEDILSYVTSKPLAFKPGAKFDYSNTNYTLAGLLIERITGNSVETEVTHRIIKKLNLKYTVFPRNFAKDVYPSQKLVHGYSFIENKEKTNADIAHIFQEFPNKTDATNFNLSFANSSGGILSTTADINMYVHALLNPGPLLNASQIEKLKTHEPHVIVKEDKEKMTYYGLGIVQLQNKKSNETFYSYSGGMIGFQFAYRYYPDRDLNIVFAKNTEPNEHSDNFIHDEMLPKIWGTICFNSNDDANIQHLVLE